MTAETLARTPATTAGASGAGSSEPAAASERPLRLAVGALAAVLVVLSAVQPVWRASLSAPQYPQGLRLVAYGTRVEGDIAEINQLNHYVGMEAFDIADVPETALWYPTIGAALALVLLGSVLERRRILARLARLARLGLWCIPIGVLADVQWRLYQYGHSVDPTATIRLDPFIPTVIGPTKVLNFTTWGYPGEAVALLVVAAALVTFGTGFARRVRRTHPHRRSAV